MLGTMSGPLPGSQQAVAKAELFAIVAMLEHTAAAAAVWTDCLSIWRRWSRGPQRAAKSRMPGLWHRFWSLLEDRQLEEDGGGLQLTWCPSHCSIDDVHRGVLPHEAWAANQAADAAAEAAARRHRLPDHVAQAVSDMDAKVALVQDRLMAIHREVMHTTKAAAPAQRARAAEKWARQRRLIIASRHKIAFRNGFVECHVCSQSSRRPTLLRWLSKGVCPGPPRGIADRFHATHAIKSSASSSARIWICTSCGAWAQRQPRGLQKPCPGRPSARGQQCLRRWRRGLHPHSDARAPAPEQQRGQQQPPELSRPLELEIVE